MIMTDTKKPSETINPEIIEYDPNKDLSFKMIHLDCGISKIEEELKYIESNPDKEESTKFFRDTITTINFKNCKPLTSKGKPIDNDKRIKSDQMEIVYQQRENIDYNDPSLTSDVRLALKQTRLNTLDNLLNENNDPNRIEALKIKRDKTLSDIQQLEKAKSYDVKSLLTKE